VEDFSALANLGGLGAFSAVVYFELRKMREAFESFSQRVVKIEVDSSPAERAQTID
jgi:hypothetical protein